MAGKTVPEHLFNAATEVETTGALLSNKINIPALLPQGPAKEWLDQRRATIRPWANFLDQRRFAKPLNFGELCKRLVRNVEYFQSNYVFVFLGLIVYCLITSPLLLIALAVFFGACYIMYLKTQQSQLVVLGRELSTAHQYSLAGAVSFPFFWLAGAGSAVFWVLDYRLTELEGAVVVHRQPAETAAESDSGEDHEPVQESGQDSDEGPASDTEMGSGPSGSYVLTPEPPEFDSSEAEEQGEPVPSARVHRAARTIKIKGATWE